MLMLYFVRHGETKWNVENRIQGQLDSPLTAKGIKDVYHLKTNLSHIKWNAIYSSPLNRALKTARIICPTDEIKTDSRLMEMNLGNFESLTMEEIKAKDQLQHYFYWHEPEKYSSSTGENFYDIKKRVSNFLDDIIYRFQSGNILIVTHGVVIKMVQLIAEKAKLDDLWRTPHVNSASITHVQIEQNEMTLKKLGALKL